MDNLNFGAALEALKAGKSVTRVGWNGKNMFITLQTPDDNSKMTRPYIYMTLPVGSTSQFGEVTKDQLIPWLASQTDIFAEDWSVVTESVSTTTTA